MTATRAMSLFIVLLIARLCALAGAHVPFSIWTPVAFLWQDALVALVFALLDRAIHREWIGWTLYATAAFYISINAGVARVLHTPLTWSMLRAAGGPLADSVWRSLTLGNVSAVTLPALAAIAFPALARRRQWRGGRVPIAVAALLVALGPYATAQIDTAGRHRNAFGALWPARAPHVVAAMPEEDWRASPFEEPPSDDLTVYRGKASGRNVVIVILESTAAQYLRPYGAELDPMPNLTAAAKGFVFDNAFAVYPESIKGLFSILCSRYPAFNTEAQEYAASPCPALPARLGAAGYRTALIHSGRFMYLGMNAIIENRGFDVLQDAGAIGGNVESSFGVDEPAAVSSLFAFIDAVPDGRRFFAMYLPTAGHHPYATPEPGPYADDGGINSYRNALRYGDESLGALFDGLRRRGLDRETLIVVFGDHGEAFGQHDGNFAHTMFVYNENVRVPYTIIAPGLIPEVRVRRPVSLIDTAPTILDLVGLPIPDEYQGVSMLDPRPRMSLFFTDYSLGWLGLVDGCSKALHETSSRRTKLFDVCADPAETRDLSSTEPDRVHLYSARLEQWISAQRLHRSDDD